MKGYKFVVWTPTVSDINVTSREPIIHAVNLKAAWKKFDKECPVQGKEWVYKVECLGTVRKVVVERFEYTPLKKPRYESRY